MMICRKPLIQIQILTNLLNQNLNKRTRKYYSILEVPDLCLVPPHHQLINAWALSCTRWCIHWRLFTTNKENTVINSGTWKGNSSSTYWWYYKAKGINNNTDINNYSHNQSVLLHMQQHKYWIFYIPTLCWSWDFLPLGEDFSTISLRWS